MKQASLEPNNPMLKPNPEEQDSLTHWRKILQNISILPAQAAEWAYIEEFLKQAEKITQEKNEERSATLETLKTSITTILENFSDLLQYFGFTESFNWNPEHCSADLAARCSEQLLEFHVILQHYQQMMLTPTKSIASARKTRLSLEALEEQLNVIYRELNSLLLPRPVEFNKSEPLSPKLANSSSVSSFQEKKNALSRTGAAAPLPKITTPLPGTLPTASALLAISQASSPATPNSLPIQSLLDKLEKSEAAKPLPKAIAPPVKEILEPPASTAKLHFSVKVARTGSLPTLPKANNSPTPAARTVTQSRPTKTAARKPAHTWRIIAKFSTYRPVPTAKTGLLSQTLRRLASKKSTVPTKSTSLLQQRRVRKSSTKQAKPVWHFTTSFSANRRSAIARPIARQIHAKAPKIATSVAPPTNLSATTESAIVKPATAAVTLRPSATLTTTPPAPASSLTPGPNTPSAPSAATVFSAFPMLPATAMPMAPRRTGKTSKLTIEAGVASALMGKANRATTAAPAKKTKIATTPKSQWSFAIALTHFSPSMFWKSTMATNSNSNSNSKKNSARRTAVMRTEKTPAKPETPPVIEKPVIEKHAIRTRSTIPTVTRSTTSTPHQSQSPASSAPSVESATPPKAVPAKTSLLVSPLKPATQGLKPKDNKEVTDKKSSFATRAYTSLSPDGEPTNNSGAKSRPLNKPTSGVTLPEFLDKNKASQSSASPQDRFATRKGVPLDTNNTNSNSGGNVKRANTRAFFTSSFAGLEDTPSDVATPTASPTAPKRSRSGALITRSFSGPLQNATSRPTTAHRVTRNNPSAPINSEILSAKRKTEETLDLNKTQNLSIFQLQQMLQSTGNYPTLASKESEAEDNSRYYLTPKTAVSKDESFLTPLLELSHPTREIPALTPQQLAAWQQHQAGNSAPLGYLPPPPLGVSPSSYLQQYPQYPGFYLPNGQWIPNPAFDPALAAQHPTAYAPAIPDQLRMPSDPTVVAEAPTRPPFVSPFDQEIAFVPTSLSPVSPLASCDLADYTPILELADFVTELAEHIDSVCGYTAELLLPEGDAEIIATTEDLISLQQIALQLKQHDSYGHWYEFIWALIESDDVPGAYWVMQSLVAQGRREIFNTKIFVALEASRMVLTEQDQITQDLRAVVLQYNPSGMPACEAMLLITSALRPALIAPETLAARWLVTIPQLPIFSQVVRTIRDFTTQGIVLTREMLLEIIELNQCEKDIVDVQTALWEWLQQDSNDKVMQVAKQLLEVGRLQEILESGLESELGNEIQEFNDELRDLTDAAQVAAILDKLTKQRVLKVTPKEYQKIIEMTTEHAQLIIKWGDLVTRLADLRIRQTANTQVVASLRDRLNYEIPLAHKELQYWKQCTSSITSTGAFTCAARMLSYLQETINPLLVKGGKSSSSIVCQEVLVQAFSRRLLWLREATLNSEGLPTLESLPRIAGAIRDLSAHSARGKRRFQIAKN